MVTRCRMLLGQQTLEWRGGRLALYTHGELLVYTTHLARQCALHAYTTTLRCRTSEAAECLPISNPSLTLCCFAREQQFPLMSHSLQNKHHCQLNSDRAHAAILYDRNVIRFNLLLDPPSSLKLYKYCTIFT